MTLDVENTASQTKPPPPPSWASIPNKKQLAIIWSVRAADFFQQAALQAYMYYQLKSFSPNASESEISFQSGVLLGIFTAAQVFTGVYWGRLADSPSWGRKNVLLFGLIGQGISCIGVGFSTSFTTAVVWRCLGGAVNATVGGARTALAEATEKKYHSRTFLLLPLAWNFANIFGPLIGGMLADPVSRYPSLLGENGIFGRTLVVECIRSYPYAVPNIFCAFVVFLDAAVVWLGLRETLAARKYHRDRGLEFAEHLRYRIRTTILGRLGYSLVGQDEGFGSVDSTFNGSTHMSRPSRGHRYSHSHNLSISAVDLPAKLALQQNFPEKESSRPSMLRIFTPNVIMVLMTVALMDFQMGGFASLWTIFLSTSPASQADRESMHLPLYFTGGLGFSPATVGLAMSILGFVGIIVQLTLYPRVNSRFGLVRSFRYCLFVFPLAYAVAPYLSLLTGVSTLLWAGIVSVAFLQICARTFAVPGAVLLTNNASPSPELLGTIHGLGAAVSSAFRTVGPIVVGHWYADGLQSKMVGHAWWLLAGMSLVGVLPSFLVKDGK